MPVAAALLANTHLGVVTVARRVGYDSEGAFSRASKRERGRSPIHRRAACDSAAAYITDEDAPA
jgi:transcriptional regulator GlxA family with amidase domain